MTTPTRTRRRPAKRAAAKPAAKPAAVPTPRSAEGRALALERQDSRLSINPHTISFRRALWLRSWLILFPALGILVAFGMYPVTGPVTAVVIALIAVVAPVPIFAMSWSSAFMPVMRLELNPQRDRYQLRIFDAERGNFGSQGRFSIFGRIGYGIDGLEDHDRPLGIFVKPEGYETHSPEGIRYVCDHTPTREKYRRRNKRMMREIIQWGSLTIMVGILAGLTYLIGVNNF